MTSLRQKLLIGTVLIIILLGLLVFYLIDQNINDYIFAETKADLRAKSFDIQQYLYNMSRQYDDDFLKSDTLHYLQYDLERQFDFRIWLNEINEEEKYQPPVKIAENDKKSKRLITSSIDKALKQQKNLIRLDEPDSTNSNIIMHFPFYDQISVDAQPVGVVGLEYSLQKEYNLIANIRNVLAGMFLILTLLVLLLVYLYIDNILTPLTVLKNSIQNFKPGQTSPPVQINTGDELEELAQSYNDMKSSIEDLFIDLQQEKGRQKDFYENMTHELKTPLTIIKGYADMFPRVKSKAKREKCLNHIRTETDRILDLVNDLLASSKSEEYHFQIEKKPLSLNQLVTEAMDLMEVKALSHEIVMNFSAQREFLLKGDSDKLKEVLLNIIDNAIKYSDTDVIKIMINSKGADKVELLIQDFGSGFPRELLIDKNTEDNDLDNDKDLFLKKNSLTGNGIKVSEEIIAKHDGSLTITSIPGQGSTVKIILPGIIN